MAREAGDQPWARGCGCGDHRHAAGRARAQLAIRRPKVARCQPKWRAPSTGTPTEMMTVVAARALNSWTRLRRHRRAVRGLNLARSPMRRASPDLRERHHRHQAQRAAALHRRRRAVRDRAHHSVGAGDVPLLAAGRLHHRGVPGRRAGRPFAISTSPWSDLTTNPRCACPAAAAHGRSRPRATRCSSPWRRAGAVVAKLDFMTSLGHGEGKGSRERLGVSTKGPTRSIMTCVRWSRTRRPAR